MKDLLRKLGKTRRRRMSAAERQRKSLAIIKKLASLKEFKEANTFMIYVSKLEEVDTLKIIEILLKQRKNVAVPKTKGREIVPCLINSLADLAIGKFNILEPKKLLGVRKGSIDLFIVPGIVFDRKGNRIGYGYGYWDRLLKDVPKKRIVGLAFESQIVDFIQAEGHDVKVPKVITEKGIYADEQCNGN